jgi:two-component system response regulator (stage 0 sporulation protein F)
VLIAEDDPEMRALVGVALRKAKFEVREFSDGARLLVGLTASWLETGELPAAIVTDLRMPGFDGFSLLQALRSYSVPVVVVTAFGDREVHARARALGARAVIDKPFDLAELRSVVEDLAAEHGSRPRDAWHD